MTQDYIARRCRNTTCAVVHRRKQGVVGIEQHSRAEEIEAVFVEVRRRIKGQVHSDVCARLGGIVPGGARLRRLQYEIQRVARIARVKLSRKEFEVNFLRVVQILPSRQLPPLSLRRLKFNSRTQKTAVHVPFTAVIFMLVL